MQIQKNHILSVLVAFHGQYLLYGTAQFYMSPFEDQSSVCDWNVYFGQSEKAGYASRINIVMQLFFNVANYC